jgi:hypothetical protein
MAFWGKIISKEGHLLPDLSKNNTPSPPLAIASAEFYTALSGGLPLKTSVKLSYAVATEGVHE